MEKEKLIIELKDWDYQCGEPGCCSEYGVEISLNGEICDDQYAGDSVEQALEFILTKLGYEFEITNK